MDRLKVRKGREEGESRRSYFIPWLEIGRRLAPEEKNERAVEREIGGDGGGSNFVRLRFSKEEEGEGKIGLGKI